MPARVRKLIGSGAVMLFLFVYVGVVVALADRLPDLWWVKLLFFVVAGTAWGLPIIPLITWMNRGR